MLPYTPITHPVALELPDRRSSPKDPGSYAARRTQILADRPFGPLLAVALLPVDHTSPYDAELGHLKASLMLLYPVMDSTGHWLSHPTKQEINRQSRLLPKHQKIRTLSGGLMGSGIITKYHLGQTRGPIHLPSSGQSSQQIVQGTVKPFALAVTSWIVCGSTGLTHLVKGTQLLDKMGFEVTSLVRMDSARDPKLKEPFIHQDASQSRRLLVPSRDCHCEFTKDICHY